MIRKDQQQQNAEYEQLSVASKKLKRKMWIVIGCVMLVLGLLLCAVWLITHPNEQKNDRNNQHDYKFYPTYKGNIMEYGAYLELNRQVEYCNEPSGYGVWQSITDENREEFDANTLFLYNYLQTVIAGDTEAYNACFHESYFEDNEPKKSFSPQMLYQMKIRYYSTENGENGEKSVTYLLEYMIFQNDGTFHDDVGSDASLPRYVTLRVDREGKILIEKIVTKYQSTKV